MTNQKEFLEQYASQNGFRNIRHFTDDGFTGTNFNRPGFKALLDEVKAGNVSTVIVKDLSRFGRNYLQVGFYVWGTETRNVSNTELKSMMESYKDKNRDEERYGGDEKKGSVLSELQKHIAAKLHLTE